MRNPLKREQNPPLSPYAPKHGLRRIKSRKLTRFAAIVIATVTVIAVGAIAGGWYAWALLPLDTADNNHVRVTIQSGAQPSQIAKQLKDAHIIRSSYAFQIYARTSGKENKLQAGTYAFAASQSVRDIVTHLTSGKTDEFSVTILPGNTLKDIKSMLQGHGYSTSEIDSAFAATYTSDLVAMRPPGASLEGFFYPDTYNVLSDESLQTIFERIFEHFSSVISQNSLAPGFAEHGLSVYQGIILSSIVQREVSNPSDQKKVASVFYNRLDRDMTLGSEVTFRYGAALLGVEPTTTLDSPYNLYIHKNLTPTPIGSPQLSAMQAVANPANTTFLYFLTGDDGITYFANTDAQHQANIKQHCQLNCK